MVDTKIKLILQKSDLKEMRFVCEISVYLLTILNILEPTNSDRKISHREKKGNSPKNTQFYFI